MSLMDHLSELRMRLVRCCIAVGLGFMLCWAVVDPIFNALVNPLIAVLPPGSHAQYTTLPEGFFTRMYIAFIAGVFVSSPVIFYQIWSFIAPGLYDEEKRLIVPVASDSGSLFHLRRGVLLFRGLSLRLQFFRELFHGYHCGHSQDQRLPGFCSQADSGLWPDFRNAAVCLFPGAHGARHCRHDAQVRRYAILAIFIVAAILTPPDVVSQLLMACPMLLLYELSIWVAAVFGRKKPAPEPEKDKNHDATSAEEA